MCREHLEGRNPILSLYPHGLCLEPGAWGWGKVPIDTVERNHKRRKKSREKKGKRKKKKLSKRGRKGRRGREKERAREKENENLGLLGRTSFQYQTPFLFQLSSYWFLHFSTL